LRGDVRYSWKSKVSRKLAAILAADIAGYSALMGNDEGSTVHGGRVIDTAGDGIASLSCATKPTNGDKRARQSGQKSCADREYIAGQDKILISLSDKPKTKH
jgi:hypothetical protein